MHLTTLSTYPVKSMRGIHLNSAPITPLGLPHDREWLLATPEGQFLTARKLPQLLLWQAHNLPNGLKLIAPNGESFTLEHHSLPHLAPVTVWKDQFLAYHGNTAADEWLSQQLHTPCRLFWLGKTSQRILNHSQTSLSFADSAPFLLTSEASLHALNSQLDTPIEMARFRANLVIDGTTPYAEESWKHIRIGEITFELFKPCTRCVMTTVDLHTAQKHPQQQPLATLARTRRAIFGINMIALNTGTLHINDPVEILSYHDVSTHRTTHKSPYVLP